MNPEIGKFWGLFFYRK